MVLILIELNIGNTISPDHVSYLILVFFNIKKEFLSCLRCFHLLTCPLWNRNRNVVLVSFVNRPIAADGRRVFRSPSHCFLPFLHFCSFFLFYLDVHEPIEAHIACNDQEKRNPEQLIMISYWRHGEGNDDPEHSDPEDIYGQDHLEVIILFRGLFDAHLLIRPSLLRFCQVAWHEGLLNHPWERLCLNWPGLENEEKQVKELTTTWPRFRYNLVSVVRSPRLIWIFYLFPECKFIFSWCVPISVCFILLPSTMICAI